MHAVTHTGKALMLLTLPALALATTTFERRWHWFHKDAGHSVALTVDGGYLVGGETWLDSSRYGIVLARTDSVGDTTSVHQLMDMDPGGGYVCRLRSGGFVAAGIRSGRYVFARGFSESGDSAWSYDPSHRGRVSEVIPADGGCLIAGRIPDSMYNMGVIKLDSLGHEEWSHYYAEPRVFGSAVYGADETRDGGFILCGDANDYTQSYLRLVRTDAAGETLWTRLFKGPIDPSLQAISETPDGGFLAVGSEFDTLNVHSALYLMRTDSNGTIIWTRNISPPGAGTRAAALCETRDNGYAVAGSIDWGDSARVWLLKLDANADTIWTSVLPGAGIEQAADVRQTADGGYVIAGTSDSAGGSVLLVKTDSLGHAGVEEGRLSDPGRVGLSVVPSPASGVVRIDYSLHGKAGAGLWLYDVTGRLVHSTFGLGASPFRLDVRSMPAGVYLLKLKYQGGTTTRKLVVE